MHLKCEIKQNENYETFKDFPIIIDAMIAGAWLNTKLKSLHINQEIIKKTEYLLGQLIEIERQRSLGSC